MLITLAQKALENSGKPHVVLRNNPHWDYLAIQVDDGVTYRMIFEYNSAYGLSFCRQWSVDENTETTVECKYGGGTVLMDCSNGLCGVRPFEFSIAYETLFKPMGIPLECIRDREHNWSMSILELLHILDGCGIEYAVLHRATY